MNFSTVVGRGDSSYEAGYVAGDNLTGAQVVPGEALCWSVTASDGRSFLDPAVVGNTNNFNMFAGIVQDTLGTGSHGVLRRYGLASVLVSGGATIVPGAHLGLIDGTPVMAITTAGLWAGTMLTAQIPCVTCLGTVTAGQGVTTVVKSFVQF